MSLLSVETERKEEKPVKGKQVRRWAWAEAKKKRGVLFRAAVLSALPSLLLAVWEGLGEVPGWTALLAELLAEGLGMCLAFVALGLIRGENSPRFLAPLGKGQWEKTAVIVLVLFFLDRGVGLALEPLEEVGGGALLLLLEPLAALTVEAALFPVKYLALFAPEKKLAAVFREGLRVSRREFGGVWVFSFWVDLPMEVCVALLTWLGGKAGGLLGLAVLLAGGLALLAGLMPYMQLAEGMHATEILSEGEEEPKGESGGCISI